MTARRLLGALALSVLASTGCAQRFLQVPVPYKTKAEAGPDTWACTVTGLGGLGFVFTEEPEAGDALGRRVTARGTGRNHIEFVRLKLMGDEDDERILEVSLGISTRRTALEPDATLAIGSLESPSRQSIQELDELMARCQRSPVFGESDSR